jgi:7-cyano-7-deazaguanine synthase
VVLLSGGLDSYTAAAIAKADGFSLLALTVNYGQRHARELASARAVAGALGVERHIEVAVDLRAIGGSALTSDADVPRDRDLDAPGIPATYVPRGTRSSVARPGGLKCRVRTTSSLASTR